MPGLRALADAVHRHGALIGMELNHGGRTTHPAVSGHQPVAPSPLPCRVTGGGLPRQLTAADIRRLIRAYADAARRCRQAGVDVLTVHGGHGYLIHQFLSPVTNHRDDEFGDQTLFLRLVLEAVLEQAGPEQAVGLRISTHEGHPAGLSADATFALMREVPLGRLDFLDISAGSYEAGEWIVQPGEWEPGILAPYAQRYRRHFGLPVGVAGRINSARAAARIVASGQADFVSLARTLHADPAFPGRVLTGDAYRPCIACNRCIDELHDNQPIGCSVNTRAGREEVTDAPHRAAPARILVVGGGPAGMETARLLAGDGHTVELMEAGSRLGGAFRLAAGLRQHPDYRLVLDWLEGELGRLGVAVRTGQSVDEEVLAGRDDDAIVVATGAVGRDAAGLLPAGAGVREMFDVRIWLASGRRADHCLIWGADRDGVGVADHLAATGTAVVLVGAQSTLAPEVGRRAKILTVPRLEHHRGVRIVLGAEVTALEERRVRVRTAGGEEWIDAPGPLLVSQGAVPDTRLLDACLRRGPRLGVYPVGAADGAGGSLRQCFASAEQAVRTLRSLG